jgi:hypothetical protein
VFELKTDKKGDKTLFYTEKYQVGRGKWVPITHTNDRDYKWYVSINREMGYQVEIDEHSMYRAWVLFD